MDKLVKVFSTLAFVTMASVSQAATVLTVNLTVDKVREKLSFQGCAKIISVPPSTNATYTFDDSGTFTEDIDGNVRTGHWSEIDSKFKKFRLTYDGAPADNSGSWDIYMDAIDTVAALACGGGTSVLRPTFVLKKFELSLTPNSFACSGKARMTFQAEAQGYNAGFGEYGKGRHRWSGSGTFTNSAC